MALAEALRLLETPGNPARDVIVLTDGQRSAWRPDEPARWSLPREIHRDISRRSGVSPRVWVINFDENAGPAGPNGSVGPLELSGGLITPDRPITITTSVSNAGSEVTDAHGRARRSTVNPCRGRRRWSARCRPAVKCRCRSGHRSPSPARTS